MNPDRESPEATFFQESLQVFGDRFQRGGIAIRKRVAGGTSIIGFADETRQVVDNLLVNAVEATHRGGRLTLSLRPSRSWKNRQELGARLTIADNGSGIPKDYLARVFEPFFTTKAEKGTGLGLWVVKGIVEKHGGSIKIRSTHAAARSGTVISIFWPSCQKTSHEQLCTVRARRLGEVPRHSNGPAFQPCASAVRPTWKHGPKLLDRDRRRFSGDRWADFPRIRAFC